MQQVKAVNAVCVPDLERLQAAQTSISSAPVLATMVNAKNPAKAWEALDLSSQRAVIDALMTITIRKATTRGAKFNPDSVAVGWKA